MNDALGLFFGFLALTCFSVIDGRKIDNNIKRLDAIEKQLEKK